MQKSFDICIACGKEAGHNSITIASGFKAAIPLIRKESAKEVQHYCKSCGLNKLLDQLGRLDCGMWVGIPTIQESYERDKLCINFEPKLIHY